MSKHWRIAALLLAVGLGMAAAQSVPAPSSLKPSGYVNDFAHVLSPDARDQLEEQAQALDQALKVQVAFVTVASIGRQDAFQYSYQLAHDWGIGAKTAANGQDKNTGLLVFLAIQDHHYYTQVGYGLEPYITDADVGTWMRAEVPQLRAANYGNVFEAMLAHIEQTLAARMPGAADALQRVPQPRGYSHSDNGSDSGNAAVFAIFFVLWIVIAFATRGRNMGGCLWPLIFMNMGGGGGYRGGGWGGGFGGGGGGFGGFGGGGFGGGGAGGSW